MNITCKMKLTHNIYKCFSLIMSAVIGCICISCSEDAPGQGDENALLPEKTITIKVATRNLTAGTRSFGVSSISGTRALGTFEGEAADNELIHSCVVAFVDNDGIVAQVKELPDETTGKESREFNVLLKQGKYTAYAFANIDVTTLTGVNITQGKNIGDIAAALYDVKADELTEESLIPMSGYLSNIEVTANGSVKINNEEVTEATITVVRMVGKVEFEFTNRSAADITIKQISFKPGAEGDVKLLPTWTAPYTTLEKPDMTLTGITIGKEITRTYTSGITIPKNGEENEGDENVKSCGIYVREVV